MNLKRINENKSKYNAIYQKKSGIIVTADWDAGNYVNQVYALEDKEKEYKWQLSMVQQQHEAAILGFDNVPVAYFDFGRVAYLMALAYGGPLLRINGLINSESIYESVEETGNFFKQEKIWEHGLYPEIFSRIHEFQERYGEVPITISDNQSSNDVLTTLLKSDEAMVAMFTQPELLHRMLSIITDSIIEVNRAFEKNIVNFAGFHCAKYLPFGMHISDDNAAFLSPETYNEFGKPYNEKLGREFGGIAYHCCMGHEQNLINMAQSEGFLGFDAMPDYNSIDKILSAIEGKGVWNVYNYSYAVSLKRQLETSDEKWFKNIIDRAEGKCGLVLNVYSENKKEALKLADKIKNYAELKKS